MRSLLVLASVAALTAAGCADDTGGTSATEAPPTTATPTTTTPGPTPDELAAAVCGARAAPDRTRIADPELNELSGLVALTSGLWGHNDSGDEARVFRIDDAGVTAATVRLAGVTAIDWEDIASGGFESGELFVGDIGDNAGARPEVTVLRFALPDADATGELTVAADQVQAITLRYPDGPRDAEALLVDPGSRDLVIVDKRYGEASTVYQATEADWSDGDATLERIGTVAVGDTPLDATTAADLGADGRIIGLRTYAGLLVFPRQEGQSVAEALVRNDACDAPTAFEVQGEALAFTTDGYTTISEGDRPRVHRFVVSFPEEGE